MHSQTGKGLQVLICLVILAFVCLTVLLSPSTLAKTDKNQKATAEERRIEREAAREEARIQRAIKHELKAFERGVDPKEKGQKDKTNAELYDENIEEVIENLEEVAEAIGGPTETEPGMEEDEEEEEEPEDEEEEISDDIEEIAEDEEEVKDEVTEAIEQVEVRNKFKIMLIGTDYKNLGQLRSNLVHNRNQIRKLTRTIEKVEDPEEKETLEEQVTTLTQERERMKTVILDNEEGFSVLGWVFKWIYGYPKDPIDEEEEEDLLDEIVDVIGDTTPGTDDVIDQPEDTSPAVEETVN